jgi:tRNA(Ile2)-agmatinylcytidine synthase
MVNLHIGFDDTDSPRGGCTTYIAALLVEKFEKLGAIFNDYPNLIRLNPNIPWKTRGNGALCLRISCNRKMTNYIFEIVADTVEKKSYLGFKNTDPGIVFFQGTKIPQEIKIFAKKTIQSFVGI